MSQSGGPGAPECHAGRLFHFTNSMIMLSPDHGRVQPRVKGLIMPHSFRLALAHLLVRSSAFARLPMQQRSIKLLTRSRLPAGAPGRVQRRQQPAADARGGAGAGTGTGCCCAAAGPIRGIATHSHSAGV